MLTNLLLLTACLTYAQTQHYNDTVVFSTVEESPIFPGGDSALVAYLTHHLHYPPTEKEKGIQGKVFVGFVIEKDGAVTNVEVKRGIGKECDAEAVKVVKEMPKWKPGKQSGVVVRTAMVLPINFKIVEQPKAPAEDSAKTVDMEKMPEFPGGEQALMDFIGTNVRYPQNAIDRGIEGRVFVQFIVEPDGSVTNIKVARGIGGGCDEEAVRVVKMMPNWIPGEAHGEKVRVQYFLPINYTLPKEQPEQIRNNQRRNTF